MIDDKLILLDDKLILQTSVTITVISFTMRKMLWETYMTYIKKKTRKGLLKLSWDLDRIKDFFGHRLRNK
ncbi:hypothetical protein BGV40_17555 [Methanosarcina sp. Ant1]|nr:hypothetical protein BGV40_17555 [Methanosarcina sp. Ant1]